MRIHDVAVQEQFDSRGSSTIAVVLRDSAGREHRASLPSGKSRGSREVTAFPFADAEQSVARLRAGLLDSRFSSIGECDAWLLEQDATPAKERIGGNVALGISLAFARMLAEEGRLELWELLRGEFFPEAKGVVPPRIFSNLVNGGAHARTNLDVQEFLVVASGGSVTAMTRALVELYRSVGEALSRKRTALPVGDEGGYALDFKNNRSPIAVLETVIDAMDLEHEFLIGLDVAASNLWNAERGRYRWEGRFVKKEKYMEWFAESFSRFKLLFSVEDPFEEDDASGFRDLLARFPQKLIVGDDLTTTKSDTVAARIADRSVNGIIVKPNQIGTVSETCHAIQAAHRGGAKAILSHRSGETDDPFLVHFARASNAYGVKIGAPCRERMGKFNELIRVYQS